GGGAGLSHAARPNASSVARRSERFMIFFLDKNDYIPETNNGGQRTSRNQRPTRSQSRGRYSSSLSRGWWTATMWKAPKSFNVKGYPAAPGRCRYSPVGFAETAGAEASQLSA